MASDDDQRLARVLAEEAGRLLVALRDELGARGAAADEIGRRGDADANALLIRRLADERPDDAVLSEESDHTRPYPARSHARRVWIIDPLDGTREYAEGRDDWAVHVALVEDHLPTAATVDLPASGRSFGTDDPYVGAPNAARKPRMVVSRTRPPALATSIAAALDATVVPMGSCGAKAMAVLRGDADLYVHAGGLNEWDACAPAAVAAASGLHASHLDGSPLRFNQPDLDVSDLLICRSDLAGATIAAVREGTPEGRGGEHP